MKRSAKTTAGFLLAVLPLLLNPPFGHSQQPVASFFYDNRGRVVRQEQDTNGDGKMDRWTYYNVQGQVERVEQDMNFDGKADVTAYYESGTPSRQEVASRNDGQIDTWYYLNAKGEIERKGQDPNRAGKANIVGLLRERPGCAKRGGYKGRGTGKPYRVF